MFINAKTDEMRSFGKLIVNWKHKILNSFIIFNNMKLSNSLIENNNDRRIKIGLSIYYGYSNFPRTRNRIMFLTNNDDLILEIANPYKNKRIMDPRNKK